MVDEVVSTLHSSHIGHKAWPRGSQPRLNLTVLLDEPVRGAVSQANLQCNVVFNQSSETFIGTAVTVW